MSTGYFGSRTSTPAQLFESDAQLRANAQKRKPLISKWDKDTPTGYIHIDDAIEYMRRRWGGALRPKHLEAFSRDDTGPKWIVLGDWPEVARGERYYMFEDIDLWVYRTITGVPASWMRTRELNSSVPVAKLELAYNDTNPESENGESYSNGPQYNEE